MTNDQMFLRTLAWQAHIGQLRIQTILQSAIHTQLRILLLLQKKEYSALEARIHDVASSMGILLSEKDPIMQYLSCAFLKLRISLFKSNTPVASYMIRSCTQGMIEAQRVLNRCGPGCHPLYGIALHLLDCERTCIGKLRIFL